MKTLTCSHSPTPLRVPFRSQWHSGMRDKNGWGYENVNGRGGWGALQWIDTDCRFLQNSRVKHNIVKPSSLQRFAHQRSKGAFQAAACVQPSGGEKKENFSLNVQPQSTRCILGILKTPHPTPSWALRERGSDNSFAREQSSNNRHMWTKPGAVLLSFHYIKNFQLNKAGAAFVEVIKVDVQTFYF